MSSRIEFEQLQEKFERNGRSSLVLMRERTWNFEPGQSGCFGSSRDEISLTRDNLYLSLSKSPHITIDEDDHFVLHVSRVASANSTIGFGYRRDSISVSDISTIGPNWPTLDASRMRRFGVTEKEVDWDHGPIKSLMFGPLPPDRGTSLEIAVGTQEVADAVYKIGTESKRPDYEKGERWESLSRNLGEIWTREHIKGWEDQKFLIRFYKMFKGLDSQMFIPEPLQSKLTEVVANRKTQLVETILEAKQNNGLPIALEEAIDLGLLSENRVIETDLGQGQKIVTDISERILALSRKYKIQIPQQILD